MATFNVALATREAVTKALEEARNAKVIGKSQEARLRVSASEADAAALHSLSKADLCELFIVAEVEIAADAAVEDGAPSVTVEKTLLPRCPRCWNHRELGGSKLHEDVCARCGDVLDAMGYTA